MQQAGVGDNFTPAALAALITFWCWARWPTSLEEISSSLSTPFSAAVKRLHRCSPPDEPQYPAGLGFGFCRVTYNGHNLVGRNGFQQCSITRWPSWPVAPVIAIMMNLLRVCLVLWHTITITNF
jgi:hypothetical protein